TIACSACHDEIDRRTHFVDAAYAKECALEGMARTQVIWMKEGASALISFPRFCFDRLPNTEELRQNPDRSRSMKSEITIN
ncbi:DUF1364 domain-containing protein, partial [Escherichia coli]|nr:DUF1364 domain-containing protein [Escherichia coli]MDF6804785.1 DUF1364 domain-containing protein [Escherichia coli]